MDGPTAHSGDERRERSDLGLLRLGRPGGQEDDGDHDGGQATAAEIKTSARRPCTNASRAAARSGSPNAPAPSATASAPPMESVGDLGRFGRDWAALSAVLSLLA